MAAESQTAPVVFVQLYLYLAPTNLGLLIECAGHSTAGGAHFSGSVLATFSY